MVASPNNRRSQDSATLQEVLENGRAYGFVETVRALSALHPAAPVPGSRGPFDQEKVRFRHNPDLGFGNREVAKVRALPEGHLEVQSNMLGLSGESSPVPQYLVEVLAIPGEEQDTARQYLDLFHHRLYALLYRGIAELEIPAQPDNRWLDRLLCLLGLDASDHEALSALSRHELLALAPLLSTHHKSRDAIETGINLLLKPYLDNPQGQPARAVLHDFEGDWTSIDEDALLRLGQRNHGLGQVALLGSRVKHRACKARVEIGTLHPSQQRHYERDGSAYHKLGALLALCVQVPIDFELDLRIRYRPQDHCTLGSSRLSVNTVLPGRNRAPYRRIVSDLELPYFNN